MTEEGRLMAQIEMIDELIFAMKKNRDKGSQIIHINDIITWLDKQKNLVKEEFNYLESQNA